MDLLKLVQVPDEERDLNWENQFFKALTESNLNVMTAEPQTGPDNWPYLMTMTDVEAEEPAQKIIDWLSTRGIGLVVNPSKEYPDYVFSYGMLWHFRETGLFFRPSENTPSGSFKIEAGANIHAGEPTPQYLPQYVRTILREFFRDQGVLQPKILVVSTDRKNYDLAFSLESLGNPPESEHAGIAEAIAWFLPPHYSIVLLSEKGLPQFTNL
ncbi:MAG: hypothetical protein ACLGGX_02755 [Bdellovibrionia bacterium]